MSSHHFVRDHQEPALIVANGEPCSADILNQLLEWNPYVLALDGALNGLNHLGIKVDGILGDLDSVTDLELLIQKQSPIEIHHTPDQNKTDLEKAFDLLLSKGYRAVHVVWATGKRLDHTLSNISTIIKYKDKLHCTVIDDYGKMYPIAPDFKKWYTQNTILSLIPVGITEGITTSNLAYPLSQGTLQWGERVGSSNHVVVDGFVTITYTTGALLLLEVF